MLKNVKFKQNKTYNAKFLGILFWEGKVAYFKSHYTKRREYTNFNVFLEEL